MNKSTLTLEQGASEVLVATIDPAEADQTVTFTSSDPAIATVTPKQGTVKGIAAGSATITATTGNGLTATCMVTVTAPSGG